MNLRGSVENEYQHVQIEDQENLNWSRSGEHPEFNTQEAIPEIGLDLEHLITEIRLNPETGREPV